MMTSWPLLLFIGCLFNTVFTCQYSLPTCNKRCLNTTRTPRLCWCTSRDWQLHLLTYSIALEDSTQYSYRSSLGLFWHLQMEVVETLATSDGKTDIPFHTRACSLTGLCGHIKGRAHRKFACACWANQSPPIQPSRGCPSKRSALTPIPQTLF